MKVYNSESGKYSIVLEEVKRVGKRNINYNGHVYKDKQLLFSIERNLYNFPFLFVENHPNGHDYLICGEDYQGQTIVELDTNKKVNYMSDGADEGFGFCWSDYKYDLKNNVLVVCGCIWAAPYEYRFYDFSDPMNSIKELSISDEIIYDSSKEPEIDGDIFKTFEVKEIYDYGENEDVPEVIKSIKTFKKVNNELIFQDEWVSEEEKENREKKRLAQEEHNKKLKDFMDNDLLYLKYKELIKDLNHKEDYYGIGQTYDKWCLDFKKIEIRYSHRIYKAFKNWTIDLSWGIETGPIKIEVFFNGEKYEDKFFEHSVNGMEEAFKYCEQITKSNC